MLLGDTDDATIFDRIADIQVDVGRDGEILQHNGRHRLWMAQHLVIEEIRSAPSSATRSGRPCATGSPAPRASTT